MTERLRIAGLCGSLREKSYNAMALRAAADLAPDGVTVDIIYLHDIPLYNQDVEDAGFPPPVVDMQDRVRAADGVLIATPEYNYSIPGVLKNAIDWLSRPHDDAAINGKPGAIIGASTSMVGTARAQSHLHDVAFYNAMPLLASDEVLIARAGGRFDDKGNLTDEDSRKFLGKLMENFTQWIRTTTG